jgi:hypothetical protein
MQPVSKQQLGKHVPAETNALCFRICHQEGPGKPGGTEIVQDISAADDMNLLGDNIDTIKKTQAL